MRWRSHRHSSMDASYVIELKADGTAAEAIQQIDDKNYAIAYTTDGRKVVKVGVAFDTKTRTVSSWMAEEQKD